MQRRSKRTRRASERRRKRRERGRKVSERRGKKGRAERGAGRRRDAGKAYAHAHASVAERSRIVLLFNSGGVIDLARLSRVRTYLRTRVCETHAAPAAVRGGNARESTRRAGSETERESYRLMTLIWEVGTSLRVIFIIHAMSRRPRSTDAARSNQRER